MAEDNKVIEDLEESQITPENGEVYIFQWLNATEQNLADVPLDELKSKRPALESTLVKIVSAPSPYPPPGRAIRNAVARCFIAIYSRAESRTLFDTFRSFLKIAGDVKLLDKDVQKIACFSCIGDLMAAFGSQYMSYMAEIATTALKILKASSSSPALRFHALLALKKTLSQAKKAVPEALGKDILKQTKSALTDKALPVQRAAADVIVEMYSDGNKPALAEVDAILTLAVKSLEGADQVTRQALAHLAGHLLATTQIERPVVLPEASKKSKDPNAADDDILGGTTPQATEVTKPLLTVQEMLTRLSTHFNKPNATKKARIGIFDFYAALIGNLGPSWAESNYATLTQHFMQEIASHARNAITRYEALLVRTLIGIILRDLVGVRMLSEQGQIGAIQELSTSYLKRWPAMMPGQSAPNSRVLVIALREVAALLQQLGNAPPPVQDAVSEPLVTLLSHSSHTVRVTASWALRCFCYTTPLRLPKAILTVMEMLQRDLQSILSPAAPSDIKSRTLGRAYGLASLISVIHERPLYVSYDISAKVLDMATQLLKRAGEHDVHLADVEIEVAWTSIAALMSLGPNFVRPHLQQLLVLWRNALPKPTSKEAVNNATRTVGEWMFLLHVRESALGAVLCFLQHNGSTLVTLDVARRISSVLGNALLFANNFVAQNVEDPSETFGGRGLGLRAREALLRRRIYQCFAALGFASVAESTQTTLLQSVVSFFAGPEGFSGSSVQAAIASSAGTFTNVWQCVDGYAYGVTFTEILDDGSMSGEEELQRQKDHLNRDDVEVSIDKLLRTPIIGACEHDPLSVCHTKRGSSENELPEPPPATTAVVDTAIELFARLLPTQDLGAMIKIVSQLIEFVRSPQLEKNLGRKAAVSINAAVAIVLALRHASDTNFRLAKDTFGNNQLTSLLAPFLKDILIDGDLVMRSASSESIGRLASLAGTTFLTNQIKLLVDQVVNNRDPHGRAGCALAFGAIYTHVGGMAAGPLLKTTVNVLMSLGNDPHPIVHFWSLNALARVINAASLAYSPFVSSTVGMLLKVYLLESHEREGGTLANANLSGDFPAYPVVCQIVDAVITVLGPDMQESPRTRQLLLGLVHEFSLEEDESIRVEAIKCFQHFLMFSPESVNIPDLVNQFKTHLSSSRRSLKLASINALYQLVQKDALAMSRLGGDRLVETLFGMLDDDSSVQGVRNVISSWLQQTVIYNSSAWIDLCQRIMSRTTASQQVADAASGQGARDDEGESLNLGGGGEASANNRSTSRWRTQLFALQCLHSICTTVARSGRQEHVDIAFAKKRGIVLSGLLVSRVNDLIKMAFTASTAYVTEIRLEGLVVLQDVIQIFSRSPDPAYEDALLLEQHQAPITAALTPAFSSDSTPEILASAVHACAIFVGCGVVKDIGRMGRILKLLTTALEQSKETGTVSLGETGELSPNASAMLRISTLSAWGQLQVSSVQQPYLQDVVNPHKSTLASLWIGALRDYASIRIDSEFLNDNSAAALDSSYSSLGKEVLLPYYAEAWPHILKATATAMQSQDKFILLALDGQDPQAAPATPQSGPRTEPTAFFHVVFGLIYEALATTSTDTSSPTTRLNVAIASLQALKFLVRPEYCGKAILQPAIFDEFIALCYRLALTEPAAVQIPLIETLASLALTQDRIESDALSPSSPRAHCLRICTHVLRHSVSSIHGPVISGDLPDRIRMIAACFSAFASVASSFVTPLREDIRGIAGLLYNDLLKDETSEVDLVGPTLTSLKTLLDVPVIPNAEAKDQFSRTVHGLISSCLMSIDSLRGREGAILSMKIKNNLLAIVLILTVVPQTAKISQAVIEHACFLVTDKLLENHELSLTAAHCARTLVVAGSSGNMVLRECARLLLPGLIEFVAKMAPLVSDGKINEAQANALGEVWKSFTALYNSIGQEHRPRMLGVLLPTITLVLSESASSAAPVRAQAVAQLLSYASSSPAAFKVAAELLNPETREILEQTIRKAVGGSNSASATTRAKPQISLKSF